MRAFSRSRRWPSRGPSTATTSWRWPVCGGDGTAAGCPRSRDRRRRRGDRRGSRRRLFACHMRTVESIGEATVRVQPGIVRDQLNRILRPYGRYFPPDPSNTAITTVGGMLGVDAAGSHSVRVGSTRDHVESIETVLAGGTVVEIRRGAAARTQLEPPSSPTRRRRPAVGNGDPESTQADDRRTAGRPLVENRRSSGRSSRRSFATAAGYYVRGLLPATHLNVPRLSGRIRRDAGPVHGGDAADVSPSAAPGRRAACCSAISSRRRKAVQEIADLEPSACDLMDRRLLSLARECRSAV